jgi:S-adenosylmethionine:tRNA ribosyltransferase-isomerase
MVSKEFDYALPQSSIAFAPHIPRDYCKLLIVDTKQDKLIIDTFNHITKYLPKESMIVFNNTKVAQARIELRKETGGKVVLLVFTDEIILGKDTVTVISDRKLAIGTALYYNKNSIAIIIAQKEEKFVLKIENNIDFMALLQSKGEMPIPPYLKKTHLSKNDLKTKYQPVFAKNLGSFAAPTASLHFTKRLLHKIDQSHICREEITLHVGYGTFAQLTQEQIRSKELHYEYYDIGKETEKRLLEQKKTKKSIIATGTTVVRALESYVSNGKVCALSNLFIQPGDTFHLVDGMITNFHVPNSSLMMLVQAFLQHKKTQYHLKEIYEFALKNDFKFLSFGDTMLII